MLESGWGGSAIARLKRNLFGFNAYDRDPWQHAWRFPSHARGMASSRRSSAGSDLPRAAPAGTGSRPCAPINRYYASDPRWADKVAILANVIDGLVVTLRERGLRFGRPALADRPVVGTPVPSTSRGAPGRARSAAAAALRFAARWTPLALVEASPDAPAYGRPARPGDGLGGRTNDCSTRLYSSQGACGAGPLAPGCRGP